MAKTYEAHIYLSKSEYEAIKAAAKEQHRSMTGQIRWLITKALASR